MVKPKKTESDANGNLKIAVRPENINNVKSTDFRTIYSNSSSFNHSAFDVSFIFGEIAGIEGEKLRWSKGSRSLCLPDTQSCLP